MGLDVLDEVMTLSRPGGFGYHLGGSPPGRNLDSFALDEVATEVIIVVELDPGDGRVEPEPGGAVGIEGVDLNVSAPGVEAVQVLVHDSNTTGDAASFEDVDDGAPHGLTYSLSI